MPRCAIPGNYGPITIVNLDPSLNFPSPAHEEDREWAMKFPFRLSSHSIEPSVFAEDAGTNIFPSHESPSIFFTEITASPPKLQLAEPVRISAPSICKVADTVAQELNMIPSITIKHLFKTYLIERIGKLLACNMLKMVTS